MGSVDLKDGRGGMRSYFRKISLLVGVLVVLGSVLLAYHQATPPAGADFAPTLSPREAARRVVAAQAADRARRWSQVLRTVAPEDLPRTPTVYFPQTGHHLSNRAGFLDFWRANGQVVTFGYPLTEERFEDGRVVQYFERVRLEHHPTLAGTEWEVHPGLLGSDVAGEHAGIPDPQNGVRYFPETQHTLYGEFLDYWEQHGGVKIFGFPISEEFEEDGRIVQYFERARLEYHPEDMGVFYRNQEQYSALDLDTLYEVLPGDLGRQAARRRGLDMAPVPQLTGAPAWEPALWSRRIEVNLSEQWLTAYEDDLVVYRAPVTTGRDGFNTPAGQFAIYDKLPMQTMTGSAGGESWYVPNVPWVMYVAGGVALHGTYWHNLFGSGIRLSHGCINLPIDDAQWLYQWADIGIPVTIHY